MRNGDHRPRGGIRRFVAAWPVAQAVPLLVLSQCRDFPTEKSLSCGGLPSESVGTLKKALRPARRGRRSVAPNITDLVAQPLPIDIPTLGADARFDPEAQPAASPKQISFASDPGDGGLLKRDRVRRLAWRTAAAGILLGIAAVGTYALMSGRIVWPRMIGAITKSDPAVATRSAMSNTSNGFAIVRAVTATTVAADGQPQNVATSFDGRTPVAVLFDTQGGKPGKDVITTSVSGMNFEQPCEPMVVTHPDATYWCQWEALGPGDYKITIQLNGAVVHELSFAISDLSEPRQEPALGRIYPIQF